jgi:hypothetical protein
MRRFPKGGGVFVAGKAQQSCQLADELHAIAVALGADPDLLDQVPERFGGLTANVLLARAAANSATFWMLIWSGPLGVDTLS